ncbi:hypothetical protein PhCBS80983_g02846 [Powellomyces hirtus]|uniref:Cytochrome c oxidase assembly protein COX20, mitochondrial n=1 Tax=Powellomyces hirtus TaxID=109895 RepID=A0A507E6G5_9FUNG|nr:hypothetical protein PhCBS80983_g02846 [Powellomyces hirtus]
MSATETDTSAAPAPQSSLPRRPPGIAFDPSKKPTFLEIAQGITPDEFKLDNVAKAPCSRKALLYGIGGGSAVAITRLVVTRRPLSSGNWGIATFGAISMLSWEFCRYQRRVVQEQLEAMGAETARRLEQEKREQFPQKA